MPPVNETINRVRNNFVGMLMFRLQKSALYSHVFDLRPCQSSESFPMAKNLKVSNNLTYPTISTQAYRQLVTQQKTTPFLVVFTADWLGEGTILDSIMEQLSEKYEGQIEFYRIDIDQSANMAEQFGLRQVPAVLMFKNGEIAGHFTGMLPQRMIEELLKQLL